jgi:hypothetical protein
MQRRALLELVNVRAANEADFASRAIKEVAIPPESQDCNSTFPLPLPKIFHPALPTVPYTLYPVQNPDPGFSASPSGANPLSTLTCSAAYFAQYVERQVSLGIFPTVGSFPGQSAASAGFSRYLSLSKSCLDHPHLASLQS